MYWDKVQRIFWEQKYIFEIFLFEAILEGFVQPKLLQS